MRHTRAQLPPLPTGFPMTRLPTLERHGEGKPGPFTSTPEQFSYREWSGTILARAASGSGADCLIGLAVQEMDMRRVAAPLRLVHGQVGMQQGLGCRRRLTEQCNSHAEAHRARLAADEKGLSNNLQRAMRKLDHGVLTPDALAQYDELVTSETCDNIRFTNDRCQAITELYEQLVARGMAES